MIALILGGSQAWREELAAAETLLAGRRCIVVAANRAGVVYEGRLAGFASLHSEHMAAWSIERGARGGNPDFRAFTPSKADRPTDIVAERWDGSSGLYATQVALFEMGASAAILCGIPMVREAGHFVTPGPWAPVTSYRQGWSAALPIIGGRVRSMDGWTAEAFGRPTPEWLAAVQTLRPMGNTAPQHGMRAMFIVENTSDETAKFNEIDPAGGFRAVRLAPGESGTYDIDPGQARFHRGGLKVSPIVDTSPAKPTTSRKATPKRPKA